MKLPIRTQPDTLSKLQSQRSALQERLSTARKRIERLDGLEDVSALVGALDERQTLESALALLDERITAAEQEARQVATAEEEAQRLDALAAERKAYDSALGAVVSDTLRLDASLQALTAVRLRLGALGDFASDGSLHLAQAVARVLLIWRITRPELLGLPAYNREEENRAAAQHDATARLERAERRRDALKDAAKQGFLIPAVDYDAAIDAVKSAKRQLALASGQPWTAQDEAQAGQAETLVFTGRSIAEIEQSLLRQTRAQDVAGPPRYAPSPPPRRR